VKAAPGGREFVALVACSSGLAALSIDMLLPAFPEMRADLGLSPGDTAISSVITTFFLGLAAGQLVYGPISDRYGRKPLLYLGLGVFVVGGLLAAIAPSLAALNAARFLWGFGAAAPRSLGIAMVRDTAEGDQMARLMSFVMTVFILIPVFAPGAGALVLVFGSWRTVVLVQVLAAVGVAVWVWLRLDETLRPEDRRSVGPRALAEAAGAVVRCRQTVLCGIALLAVFGVMTSYIGSAEVMVDEVFGEADRFPLIFGVMAATLAIGSLLSARLVVVHGLGRVLQGGSAYLLATSLLLFAIVAASDGSPPLPLFLVGLGLLLPGISALVPSSNTAAMAPLGRVAGMGAAVLGTVTTAGGALLGGLTDNAFDGTALPFAAHLLAYAVVCSVALAFVGRHLTSDQGRSEVGSVTGGSADHGKSIQRSVSLHE
jgi:DHA1 family bicyclomycin/chloramphenicol resistance-like MFS transporter